MDRSPLQRGGYQKASSPYGSPVSGSSRSSHKRRRRTRRHGRKKTLLDWKQVNWVLVAVVVTPLVLMLILVCMFLGRIETPRPALVLSPEQVNEIHQAQEALHQHALLEQQQQREHPPHHGDHHGHHNNKHHENPPPLQHHEQPAVVKEKEKKEQAKNLRGGVSTTHVHDIPNILIFTHSINLLEAKNLTGEDLVLQKNVRHTIRLHKGATVNFLTDENCMDAIQQVMGPGTPLVGYFEKETEGMYKADICRGAALYLTGGLYFDVDIRARMSVWEALGVSTKFVVPQVHVASKHRGAFFQAFIGATPQHKVLHRYLELFIEFYEGRVKMDGPLGVLLLRRAYDDVMKDSPNESNEVEFWHEVLYRKEFFPNVKPPNWGKRRACHFVVVANKKQPFVVPFYSRVKGSRMCGGKDTNAKPERLKPKH